MIDVSPESFLNLIVSLFPSLFFFAMYLLKKPDLMTCKISQLLDFADYVVSFNIVLSHVLLVMKSKYLIKFRFHFFGKYTS